MDDFTTKMLSGLLLMASGICQWDEMTDDRLTDLESQLNVFGDAITYERELREAALEAAGGRDVKGDLNRAMKVNFPDIKYGEGFCEKHQKIYQLRAGVGCPWCKIESFDVSDIPPGWKSKSMSKGNI